MRTTLALDDELLAKAQEYTGVKEKSELVNQALRTLVQIEAGRRLTRLGGTDPGAKAPPRRRPKIR
jgi:Arc/MetJ family transcription regulator